MSKLAELNDDIEKSQVQHDEFVVDDAGGDGVQGEKFDYIPGTDEEKALVRKIDRRLIPMLWWMYIWNYLDR
jgi:hypothetical protein